MDILNCLNKNGYEVKKLLSSGSYGDCFFVRNGNISRILKVYKSNDYDECQHEEKVYDDLHGKGLGKDWLFKAKGCVIDGHHMLEMETYEGDTLEKVFFDGEKKLTISEKLQLLIEACKTIAYMHNAEKSYIHLDIKPSNFYVSTNSHLKPIDLGSAVNLQEMPKEDEKLFYTTMNAIGYMSTKEYASKRVREFNDMREEYKTLTIENEGKVEYLISDVEKEELLNLVHCIGIKDDIYSLICCVFNALTNGQEVEFWLDHDGECENISELLREILIRNNIPDYLIPELEELFLELDGPNQNSNKEVSINSVEELIKKLEEINEGEMAEGISSIVLRRFAHKYAEDHFSNIEIDPNLLTSVIIEE